MLEVVEFGVLGKSGHFYINRWVVECLSLLSRRSRRVCWLGGSFCFRP